MIRLFTSFLGLCICGVIGIVLAISTAPTSYAGDIGTIASLTPTSVWDNTLDIFLSMNGELAQFKCLKVAVPDIDPTEGIPLADRTNTPSPNPTIFTAVPPTVTEIPSATPEIMPTPSATPQTCSVTVTLREGINKREEASTKANIIGGLSKGWTVTLDSIVETTSFLWGRDQADQGWFVMQAWGTWWIEWGDECYYAQKTE